MADLEELDAFEGEGVALLGCPAIGVGGVHSERYGDPDDGVCQWCGHVVPPSRSTPPEGS